MAYILEGVVGGLGHGGTRTTKHGTRGGIRVSGLGDDAKKEALKKAKEALRASSGLPAPSGSSGSSTKDESDGKIFGLPPVAVAAGVAVLGYFGLRFVQSKRAR